MTGNQEPKAVDITQAAIDSGAEVKKNARVSGGLSCHRLGLIVDVGPVLQELSRRVTVAMRESHGKSVAVRGMKSS